MHPQHSSVGEEDLSHESLDLHSRLRPPQAYTQMLQVGPVTPNSNNVGVGFLTNAQSADEPTRPVKALKSKEFTEKYSQKSSRVFKNLFPFTVFLKGFYRGTGDR
nr:hypothetical protein Itr_chr04CG14880 [Ipomoea trifida]